MSFRSEELSRGQGPSVEAHSPTFGEADKNQNHETGRGHLRELNLNLFDDCRNPIGALTKGSDIGII
jgi:hypothetical protein